MTDDVSQADAQQTLLAGEKAKSGHVRAAGLPARPPPPKHCNELPAQGVVKVLPKSAFDDLNDSMFEAFGGSPSKSSPLHGAVGFSGQRQPIAEIIGSSSQQHAFAPNTNLFSSPVKSASNIDSAIGGGSL